MNAIAQSNFLQALGWAVLNSLWQMALLWVAYQAIGGLFRISKASQKSALATSLLFSGFAWFLFNFFTALGDATGAPGYSSFVEINGNDELNKWLHTTLPLASLAYLILLALPVLNFIRNYRYVRVIRRYGLSKAHVNWRMFVQKMSGHMGIRKPVHIWMSEFVSSPVTIGYLKPVILLPVAAVNHLSPAQIEAVLLHELSHIKRFDYLINLVSKCIQALLYFNPFVKAFSRIIEREREKSCDEIVMQFQYEPHGYASALLTLEKAAQAPVRPLAVAASGGKRTDLLGRVESILGVQKKNVFSFNKLAGVLAALFCFIALNGLLILSRPGATHAGTGFLSSFSAPLLFNMDNAPAQSPAPAKEPSPATETNTASIINHPGVGSEAAALLTPAAPQIEQPSDPKAFTDQDVPAITPFAQAALIENSKPVLTAEQEQQVAEALEASKKVLEAGQWKQMEKSIADAMTVAEKSTVKHIYEKAMDKVNWNKMADNLRLAYDQINWNKVNTALNIAMSEIKLDSLQQVYNIALSGINEVQRELTTNGLQGIPDSDVTLQSIEKKKTEIQIVVEKIKAVRDRKVIHL